MVVGIVGLGLVGGSIGLALRHPSRRIIGYDRLEHHARVAKDRYCVDELAELPQIAQAELVFVSVPPAAVISVAERLAEHRGPETVVTDCASVKAPIAAEIRQRGWTWFVPGHPMAGHEKSGPQFATPWLFRDARWLLCTEFSSAQAVKSVRHAVQAMHALPVMVPAAEHDRSVAVASHLPHVLAMILSEMGETSRAAEFGAGSWKDLTRVAGVNAELWTQILRGNRDELKNAVHEAADRLRQVALELEHADDEPLRERLRSAERRKS
jgi:prephenate dehydrogenase